jgi:hypothetical protein
MATWIAKKIGKLKDKLSKVPMLKYSNLFKLFQVHTNASEFPIGNVFM